MLRAQSEHQSLRVPSSPSTIWPLPGAIVQGAAAMRPGRRRLLVLALRGTLPSGPAYHHGEAAGEAVPQQQAWNQPVPPPTTMATAAPVTEGRALSEGVLELFELARGGAGDPFRRVPAPTR